MFEWVLVWLSNRRYNKAHKEALRAAIDLHSLGCIDKYKKVNRLFYDWENAEMFKPVEHRFRNPPNWNQV